MATTINAQNALQIRERPMDVYITFQTGSTATISTYTPSGSYKSYDSTLGNTDYSMRNLADLSGDGFPLDGSCDWYEALSPSVNNGKLGLRGTAGQNLTLGISAGSTLTTVTVATRKVDTITVGGTTYPATGLNVIPINASSATLVFTPAEVDGRAEVDYIVPGIILNVTNDDLVSCTLALRGNLSIRDHTWEESEIEFEMYYPYDISSSFAYVQNDWPITYQAGYDSDLSETRKFYLSEPITQEDNIITIKGVDASHLLDSKTMSEQWYSSHTGNARQTLYNKFVDTITSSGISLIKKRTWSGSSSGSTQYAIIPEMSARDFVSGVMNLTLSYKRNGTAYGIQFVDAGIPSVEWGDGTTYGRTWTINKSEIGEFSETFDRNIAKITNPNSDRKYAETISTTNTLPTDNIARDLTGNVNQQFDYSMDGWYRYASPFSSSTGVPGDVPYKFSIISRTPSRIYFKVTQKGTRPFTVGGQPSTITGGTNAYSNPDGLPGETLEMDPFVYGNITDANSAAVFNYQSLFDRSERTVSFTWKGDPRMQPLDWITINNDTGDGRGNITIRATSIELAHEGGGTIAKITGREWS